MENLSISEAPTAADTAFSVFKPVVMPDDLPTSLLGFAHLVLATPDPTLKCAITREGVSRMRAGKLRSIRPSLSEIKRTREEVGLLDEPPRQQDAVPPGRTGKRYVRFTIIADMTEGRAAPKSLVS